MKKLVTRAASFLMIIVVLLCSINIGVFAEEQSSDDEVTIEHPKGGLLDFIEIELDADSFELSDGVVFSSGIELVNSLNQTELAYWNKFSTDYFYNQLSNDEERAFWRTLEDICNNLLLTSATAQTIKYSNGTTGYGTNYVESTLAYSRVHDIMRLFYYSNPQYYFILNGCIYYSIDSTWYYAFPVYRDFVNGTSRATATSALKTAIDSNLAKVTASDDLMKISQVHTLVCEMTTYNNDAANGLVDEEDSKSQSAYSCFITNDTVCAGYTHSVQLLLNALGFESVYVSSSGHAWNLVKYNDNWYQLDATWADNDDYGIYLKYFLKSYASYATDSGHSPIAWEFEYLPDATLNSTISTMFLKNDTVIEMPSITGRASVAYTTSSSDGKYTLNLSSDQVNANIYYSLDGSNPDEASVKCYKYTAPIVVNNSAQVSNVKFIAVCDGYLDSEIVSATVNGGSSGNSSASGQQTLPSVTTNGTPASPIVTVEVSGTAYTKAAKDILAVLNAYRYEACQNGYPDPRDTSRKLTMADYSPLTWSLELEAIARQRAVEATYCLGHTRPNGLSCFTLKTVSPSLQSYGENIAWGFYNENSMMSAIDNQWVGPLTLPSNGKSERYYWINQVAGETTGHYTSIINPDNKYVGIGWFEDTDQYWDCAAAEFSKYNTHTEEKCDISGAYSANMDILQSSVTSVSISNSYGKTEFEVGESLTGKLDVIATFTHSTSIRTTTDTGIVRSAVAWSSTNTSVANVSSDGTLNIVGAGTTTISATVAGRTASLTITVKPDSHTESASFFGYSGTYNRNDITMYLIFEISEGAYNNPATIIKSVNASGEAVDYTVSELKSYTSDNGYKIYVPFVIKPKEMTNTCQAQIFAGEKTLTGVVSRNFAQYANAALNQSTTSESNKKVMQALIDYGFATQNYLNYNEGDSITSYLKNGIAVNDYQSDVDAEILSGITDGSSITDNLDCMDFMGASLLLQSQLSLKLYFTIDSGFDGTTLQTTGGFSCTSEQVSENIIAYTISNIKYSELTKLFQLKFTKAGQSLTISYSVNSYIKSVLNSDSANESLKKVCRALYYIGII